MFIDGYRIEVLDYCDAGEFKSITYLSRNSGFGQGFLKISDITDYRRNFVNVGRCKVDLFLQNMDSFRNSLGEFILNTHRDFQNTVGEFILTTHRDFQNSAGEFVRKSKFNFDHFAQKGKELTTSGLNTLSYVGNEIVNGVQSMDGRVAKIAGSGVVGSLLIFNGVQNIRKGKYGWGSVKILTGLTLATYSLFESTQLAKSVQGNYKQVV